jgi:hypothetical protein
VCNLSPRLASELFILIFPIAVGKHIRQWNHLRSNNWAHQRRHFGPLRFVSAGLLLRCFRMLGWGYLAQGHEQLCDDVEWDEDLRGRV